MWDVVTFDEQLSGVIYFRSWVCRITCVLPAVSCCDVFKNEQREELVLFLHHLCEQNEIIEMENHEIIYRTCKLRDMGEPSLYHVK